MTIEQFRHVLHQVPFQPFIVHLADGRKISVHHRDFVSISPSGRTFIVHQLDDSFSIIDLLLVTRLEVRNGRAGAGKKGKKAD